MLPKTRCPAASLALSAAAGGLMQRSCSRGRPERFRPLACPLTRFSGRGLLQPATEVGQRDVGERSDPLRAVVETWDVVELAATRFQEIGPALLRDLFERLQAVADEAGTGDVDPAATGA